MTLSCPQTTLYTRSLLRFGRCLALLILVGMGSGVVWGAYSGTGTFTKITSLANLTNGYYVIVNSGDGFAMNNTHNGTYLGKTAVSPLSNSITNPAASIVWKIETNGSGRTIYNEVTSKYISYTGSNNDVQVVNAVSTNNQKWDFTYAASVFSATNLAVTGRILQYNSSSPRFACYTSAQQKLLLYKMESASIISPTVQASSINFSNIGQSAMTINWTNGDGTNRTVFVKEGNGIITNPVDNTNYSASTDWNTKGTQLGPSGYYCVYNGSGSSVTLTNLIGATTYNVQIFEYNGITSPVKYLTTTVSGNPNNKQTAPSAPNATAATAITANGFTANWNAVAAATGYKIDVYKKTGNYATDLIISEYVEGSSNNKAIEIYNGTGAAVDLSNYSIKKQTNGSGSFGGELILSGTLTNGEVYIVANSSASPTILAQADQTSASTPVDFNGNDAVALYKNGNQIDVVGTVGQTTDWGKDATLIRKSSISSPTTTYSVSDWDSYGTDIIVNLGSHSYNSLAQNALLTNQDVGNVLSYTVTGIEPNTEYYYVVRAYNANGTSNNSNEIQHIHFWTGATSTAWNVTTNWISGVVPPADASVGIKADAANHCLLNTNHSVSNIILNSGTKGLKVNGHNLTIKGNIYYVNGAQIDATTAGSTVEFAGTTSQTIGSNLFTSDQVQNLTISNAAGVVQNSDLTVNNVFAINSGKWYQINAAKLLTVNGNVTNLAGAGGLFIKANENEANASFIFPQGQTVQATVEFYSKASWNLNGGTGGKYKWQYFGIPVSASTNLKASPTFDGAFVRKYNEAGTGAGTNNEPVKRWLQLTNASEMEPFAGYEIVQAAAKSYYIQGTLVNDNFSSGQLTYTSGVTDAGSHIFSNPYTAAIDVREIDFGTETDGSVYQFHTGSHNDWGTNGTGTQELVGQYIVSPKSIAGNAIGIPRYISSMQGFLIKKLNSSLPTSNFSIYIPYSAVKSKNTTVMRSPEQEKSYTTIDVNGNRFADKVWIFIDENCSRAYENGWDGRKILGSILTPQLLIREVQNDLQISAVDNINNTVLAFQAGEDASYTLTFRHTNIVYPELYLIDTETNSVTDISATGSTYSFTATSSATPVERFKIVTGSDITTGNSDIVADTKIFSNNNLVFVNNKSNCSGMLKIMDLTGKVLLTQTINANTIATIQTEFVSGNYIATFENCLSVFRQTIVLRELR